MASAQFTDEELFSELKRFGFTPGPVTENTRPVYLKKLKKLREEQEQHGSRSGKRRSSGAKNCYIGGSNYMGSRPDCYDVTHPGSSSRPGRKSSVLSFSSDESDAENTLKTKAHGHNNRVDRSPKFQIQSKSRSVSKAANTANRSQYSVSLACAVNSDNSPDGDGQKSVSSRIHARSSQEPKTDDWDAPENDCRLKGKPVKKPRSFNGCGSSQLNATRVPGDYSDSDEEGYEGLGAGAPQRGTSHSRPGDLQVPFLSPAVVPGYRSAAADRGVNANQKVVGGERQGGDGDLKKMNLGHRLSRKSINVSSAEMCDDADQNNHIEGNHGALRSSNSSRVSIGLRPRFSTYSSPSHTCRGNHSNHSVPNHSYSQALPGQTAAVPEDALLQQFKREEVASSARFSAHYLSMSLLTAACLFFLLLGLMYLRMRGSGSADTDAAGTYAMGAGKMEKDLILNLLHSLHNHLAHIAQNEKFEDFILTSLEWIIRTGQDVGIRLTGHVADEPVTDVSEIFLLESSHPRMSFTCRFQRAILTVMSRMFLITVVVCSVWIGVYYMKYRWRKEEEETRQMYDMVESIVDVLKSHSEACQENQDLQPYLPIPHVRDSLVQPQDRKKMKKIWDHAVRFLSANESRIQTETQRIGGADFLVWRWIQPTLSCEKSSSVPSKVWQGKAFPLDRRNSPPNSLTPCLKIRNMFDPVMEVGENWDLAIHEAILEKCSDNDGIVHIAVDKNSREGCVYVKCLSAESSGKAFKALHGSWFDGKLVTVKYLRLDRYHQRFPQAHACSTPLRASHPCPNTPPTLPSTV
uniref:Inner nuclear membrane protein Man1 n=1 Tax=Takifugu rubripes TaxID=31033 RepID=A0A674MF07_TAKRU